MYKLIKINLINCSEIKKTQIYYNYKKVGHILLNYRQKKPVKEKTEKENLKKKLKFIPKRELATMAKKINKQINDISEFFKNNKKKLKQIVKLPENLKYCN